VNEPISAGISIYDRLHRNDAELCQLLASGAARRELTAVFGAAEYAVLAALARATQRGRRTHAEPVYILPGIMGTQLGTARPDPEPTDLLWLDPQDVIDGGLERLRLPGAAALHALGAIPYSYLSLQLRLRAAGYTVVMHDYDWRSNLRDLARLLSARLAADPAPSLAVVAHSMGGLIARAAMRLPGFERVRRLITLGAPHAGSFGAVQAIRGTYPVVRRLAALDRHHDAEILAARVFSTFPSIHQLLPSQHLSAAKDMFEIGRWPRSGPQPDQQLLRDAREFVTTLPPPDARCIAISGTHQRTVVDLRLVDDDFHYEIGDAGDGTVPLASAQLQGCDNYYVRCEHSELPRSVSVARALVELLRQGRTTRLSSRRGPSLGRHVTVSDRALRGTWNEKVDWARFSPAARRDYLNRLNQPPPHYAAPRIRRRRSRL
jgi:pimeloyl-ACP methyl ester carboxylesterase